MTYTIPEAPSVPRPGCCISNLTTPTTSVLVPTLNAGGGRR